jgi:hypothetical protein
MPLTFQLPIYLLPQTPSIYDAAAEMRKGLLVSSGNCQLTEPLEIWFILMQNYRYCWNK